MGESGKAQAPDQEGAVLQCKRCKKKFVVDLDQLQAMVKNYEEKFGIKFSESSVVALCGDCKKVFYQ